MQSHMIEEFRQHGLSQFGIQGIRLYQKTLSQVLPSRCRHTPSCSQYGIEALQEWGILEGLSLIRDRLARCRRPNGGYDPVPKKITTDVFLASSAPRSSLGGDFESVSTSGKVGIIEDYAHQFKLILSYPVSRGFISKDEFKTKIAEFNRVVLEIPQYTLQYKVNKVEVGQKEGFYLARFAGTTSGEYLINATDEVVRLLIIQLEGFLLTAQTNEFIPLYFEVDGQVILEPEIEDLSVPSGYIGGNFWTYTSDSSIWDDYWGYYLVETLVDLLDVISSAALDGAGIDSSVAQGVDLNTFDGDVLDESGAENGCDLNLFDGDGCDLDGCDLDGCDLDGCDLDGCDLAGCSG